MYFCTIFYYFNYYCNFIVYLASLLYTPKSNIIFCSGCVEDSKKFIREKVISDIQSVPKKKKVISETDEI